MSSPSKSPSFIIGVAINAVTIFLAWGLPMILPSTPLNGIIIIVIGITISIPFFVWAYALHKGKKEIKEIFPQKRMSRMVACLGILFICIGLIIIISQLDFHTPIDKPPPPNNTSHIQSDEAIKQPPDLANAKQTLINSINHFEPNYREKLKDVSTIVPGYFEFSADPTPNDHYSYPSVTTKDNFSTHFYASVRLAAMDENVQTMDFFGRGIAVCISPDWSRYLIWETEQLQTPWRLIRVKIDPALNYVAIYQKGRNIEIYINDHYVDSYTKRISPHPGPLTVALKANKINGGKMFFREFSVWDFGNP